MTLIITTNSIPVGCTFYDRTYSNGLNYWSTPNMSWDGSKWLFSSSTGGILYVSTGFSSYRPQTVRITYTSVPDPHQWSFTIRDTNLGDIASSGLLNPGLGQFEITMPLTFSSYDIGRIIFSWPSYNHYGSIDKIEFCSVEPPQPPQGE